MKNSTFIVILCLLAATASLAQQANAPSKCGYTGMSPWLHWYHDHKSQFAQKQLSDTAWINVPVTLHSVGTDAGTNYYPEVELLRNMCDLNRFFEPLKVRFYLVPGEMIVKHANTSWYDHDFDNGAIMIESTKIPGRLNIYYVDNPAGNCGYAWIDAVVMNVACSGRFNTTIAHEVGHHLSLPHTFVGWEGTNWNYTQPAPAELDNQPVELVARTNCYEAADRFCDTPVDYLNFRWPCDSVAESNITQKDPDGVEFKSDGTFYMSYSLDACTGRFSDEQMAAMRANLETEHADYLIDPYQLLPMADSAVVNLLSPVDSAIQQYNNITISWEAVPNATFYRLEVSLSPSFSILFFNQFVSSTVANITTGVPNNRTLYWRVRPYNELDLCKPLGVPKVGIFKTRNLVSSNNLERTLDVQLAPNPSIIGQSLTLKLASLTNEVAQISVVDAAGRSVFAQSTGIAMGDNQFNVSTEGWSAGMYYLHIQTEQGHLVKKLAIVE